MFGSHFVSGRRHSYSPGKGAQHENWNFTSREVREPLSRAVSYQSALFASIRKNLHILYACELPIADVHPRSFFLPGFVFVIILENSTYFSLGMTRYIETVIIRCLSEIPHNILSRKGECFTIGFSLREAMHTTRVPTTSCVVVLWHWNWPRQRRAHCLVTIILTGDVRSVLTANLWQSKSKQARLTLRRYFIATLKHYRTV